MTLVLLDVEAAPTEPKAPPTEEVGFLRHMHKKGTGNHRISLTGRFPRPSPLRQLQRIPHVETRVIRFISYQPADCFKMMTRCIVAPNADIVHN